MTVKGKYVYRCGMPTCGQMVGTNVAPTIFPTCNGDHGSHHRLMDFVEDLSKEIPSHVQESGIKKSVLGDKDSGYKTRDGGNWV